MKVYGKGKGDEKMLKKQKTDKNSRILFIYLAVSLFLFVFSRIYSCFSHGISSPWMTFLFAWPLILGGLPSALRFFGFFPKQSGNGVRIPLPGSGKAGRSGKKTDTGLSEAGLELYRYGIAAVSVGSLLQGIMEIAGTDSAYPGYLLLAGAVMLAAGILLYAVRGKK